MKWVVGLSMIAITMGWMATATIPAAPVSPGRASGGAVLRRAREPDADLRATRGRSRYGEFGAASTLVQPISERAKDSAIPWLRGISHFFRMPLDCECPPVFIIALHCLDDSIWSASSDFQSRRGIENALMMERIHCDASLPDSSGNSRIGLDVHLMDANVSDIVNSVRVMVERAGHARADVLDECAA